MVVALGLAGACGDDESSGSDEDRATEKCRVFIGTLCDKYVECGALFSSGEPFTPAACDELLPGAVASCLEEDRHDIEAASDAAIDACTGAIATLDCSLVCNRIPEDPAACLALDGYDPATETVSCAP